MFILVMLTIPLIRIYLLADCTKNIPRTAEKSNDMRYNYSLSVLFLGIGDSLVSISLLMVMFAHLLYGRNYFINEFSWWEGFSCYLSSFLALVSVLRSGFLRERVKTRRTLSGPRWTYCVNLTCQVSWRTYCVRIHSRSSGTQQVQILFCYLTRQVHKGGPFSDLIYPSWFLPLMFSNRFYTQSTSTHNASARLVPDKCGHAGKLDTHLYTGSASAPLLPAGRNQMVQRVVIFDSSLQERVVVFVWFTCWPDVGSLASNPCPDVFYMLIM